MADRRRSYPIATLDLMLVFATACSLLAGLIAAVSTKGAAGLAALALAITGAACCLVTLWQVRGLRGAARAGSEANERVLRAASALQQLREALDELPVGLEIYDSEDRLVLFNRRLMELYPWMGFDKKVGQSFKEILRDSISRGKIPMAVGHEEQWLAQRLALRGTRDGPLLQSLKGGHWINTYERRTRSNFVVGVRLEVTELVEKTRELEDSRTHLQAIIKSAAAAIILTDRDGVIIELNAAAAQLFRYAASEIVGQPLARLLPAFDATGAARHGEPVHRIQPMLDAKFEGFNQAGTALPLRVSISEIQTPVGRQYVVIIADMTQRKQAEAARLRAESLEAENRQIQAVNRAKSEFLATMSHEIRAPMNAILGLSYLALQCGLEAKPHGYVLKVHNAAENLVGIVNDILDFSKVEAGEMQLENVPFALAGVLDLVMDTAADKARVKGLAFTLELEPSVPKQLSGDALRLGQVLMNLCDNAIKFTERGQVLVRVESVLQLGNQVELLFCVGDTGPGIPSNKQRIIFDKFTQADVSTARGHGGTGLGLAICRQLVDLMGGVLGVQSQLGSGSTFHFTARFGVASADDRSELTPRKAESLEVESGRRPWLRGAKVLLAEDNEVNQLVACEMLRVAGIEVLVASNGRQALDMLKAHPGIELVLMDCYMPVMDGFAATRAIRANKQFLHLPVLAMTANVLPDDLLNCRVAGMNDHVAKPFSAGALFDVLTRWLGPDRRVVKPLESDAAPRVDV